MRYTVWVADSEEGQRVTLTQTDDGEKAADLASALVGVASGAELVIGVHISGAEKAPRREDAGTHQTPQGEKQEPAAVQTHRAAGRAPRQ